MGGRIWEKTELVDASTGERFATTSSGLDSGH